MNDQDRFELELRHVLEDEAPRRGPDDLTQRILDEAAHVRRRPRWLTAMTVRSMQGDTGVGIGSPRARALALVVLTSVLAILAIGTVAIGLRLVFPPAIVVAADGSGDFRTIGEALEVAGDGDTILVREGVYDEAITIRSDIVLRGDEPTPARVIIRIPGDAIGIRLRDSDARVESLTVWSTAAESSNAAVDIGAGSPTLRDLVIDIEAASQLTAVRIVGGSPHIADSDITGTVTLEVRADALVSGSRLTALDDVAIDAVGIGTAAEVRDNVIRGRVLLSTDTEVTLVGNDMAAGPNAGDGEMVATSPGGSRVAGVPACLVDSGSERTRLIDNDIHDSGTGFCGVATIERTRFVDNELAVAMVGRSELEITDGTLAFELGPSRMSDSVITGNGAALHLADGAELEITGTAICDNTGADRVDDPELLVISDPAPCPAPTPDPSS